MFYNNKIEVYVSCYVKVLIRPDARIEELLK